MIERDTTTEEFFKFKGQVAHDTDIRCPRCGFVRATETSDGLSLAGTYRTVCKSFSCYKAFDIEVLHRYTSPALDPVAVERNDDG